MVKGVCFFHLPCFNLRKSKKLVIKAKLEKPWMAIVRAVPETFASWAIHDIFVRPMKPIPIDIVRVLNVADLSLFCEAVYVMELCMVEYAEVKAPVQIIKKVNK